MKTIARFISVFLMLFMTANVAAQGTVRIYKGDTTAFTIPVADMDSIIFYDPTGTLTQVPAATMTVTASVAGFTVNGIAPTIIVSIEDGGNKMYIWVPFPATAVEKTVTVGAQQGTLTAGMTGETIYFPVTTTGFDDDIYEISTWTGFPSGTQSQSFNLGLFISNNSGSFDITSTDPLMVSGTYSATITIDGVTSNTFTITVNGQQVPAATMTITAPVVGEMPSTTITVASGAKFTAVLNHWSIGGQTFTGPFQEYNGYIAHITLTAASGYTFTGYLNNEDIANFKVNGMSPAYAGFSVTNGGTKMNFVVGDFYAIVLPAPTDISFAQPIIYTWFGKETDLGITTTPAGADPSKATWTKEFSHNVWPPSSEKPNSAGKVTLHAYNSAVADMPNEYARYTAFGKTVEVRTRFGARISANSGSSFGSTEYWFDGIVVFTWERVTLKQYVRAYYAANATEWAWSNNIVHDFYLTRIPLSEYTITSPDPDIVVTLAADGLSWELTRTSASVLKYVDLTITCGAATYTHRIALVD